jgi:hypothetical protein
VSEPGNEFGPSILRDFYTPSLRNLYYERRKKLTEVLAKITEATDERRLTRPGRRRARCGSIFEAAFMTWSPWRSTRRG